MKKKFLVLSDSHRVLTHSIAILNEISPHINGLIHLGDNTQDAYSLSSMYPGIEIYSVCGNCDYDGNEDFIMHVGTKKIFLTHGHRYNVKYRTDRLIYSALEKEVDAVLYGHTHIADISYEEKLSIMNPGSISIPRNRGFPTYGIMDVNDNGIEFSIAEVRGKNDFRVVL